MGDERLNKIDQIGSDYIPAKFNQITVRAARGYHVRDFGHFISTSKIMDWTIIRYKLLIETNLTKYGLPMWLI